MPYSAEISRTNPSCILFLLDQSGSMQDDLPGETGRKKADSLATVINRLLQNLVLKCAKSEGVRDYYYIGIIGYGGKVAPAFAGALSGRELVPISEIANSPARIEERIRKTDDGAGGLVNQTIKFPVWFDAVARGGTPMCQALATAGRILQGWLAQHPDCYPPIVINITDGESTDGNPETAANNLRELRSTDGPVLCFNIHISSTQVTPIDFPANPDELTDEHARVLFNLSSPLPDQMRGMAEQDGKRVLPGARGFVFNADMVSLINFLDIGTRVADSNLR